MKTAEDLGHQGFKLRIVLPGVVLHALSATEPVVKFAQDGRIELAIWQPITGTEHGDTVAYVRWSEVIAFTWRRA